MFLLLRSDSTACALFSSLNFSAASGSSGFLSGWYRSANFLTADTNPEAGHQPLSVLTHSVSQPTDTRSYLYDLRMSSWLQPFSRASTWYRDSPEVDRVRCLLSDMLTPSTAAGWHIVSTAKPGHKKATMSRVV